MCVFFFFNDPATTEIYTLALHDALPILSLRLTDTEVTLTIGDDGPGISPANRSRIFERFYRADTSRSTPGNGLGLSLVKAIADLHGAAVSLDETAPGAVFVLIFQRQRWSLRFCMNSEADM